MRYRCSDIPDNLIRNGAHHVGETVLVSPVALRRDGCRTRGLLILFDERAVLWVCKLQSTAVSCHDGAQKLAADTPKSRYRGALHRRLDTLQSSTRYEWLNVCSVGLNRRLTWS